MNQSAIDVLMLYFNLHQLEEVDKKEGEIQII